jgi:hypothetical protein
MRGTRLIRFLLLGVVTVLWFAIGGEVLCRFEGDWRLDVTALTKRLAGNPSPSETESRERALIATVINEKGVDPEWFFLPPASIQKPSNPILQARTDANPTANQQQNYLWNDALLGHPEAGLIALLQGIKVDTLFAFPSYDGSTLPRYRLYPDNDYRPTPWITNRFGWLSPDVAVHKPPHTIRVGIIGDSTSQNTYGFYLQSFLDAWARAKGFDVRFEVLNTARQGLGFEDELRALRFELGPMGLDYVYEYFAPVFALVPPVMAGFATFPRGVEPGRPPPEHHPVYDAVRRLLDPLVPDSALALRLRDVITHEAADSLLREPAKPPVTLRLPPGTEGRVVLSDARKDSYFGAMIDQLDRYEALAHDLNATPFVSTERVCAWNGMVLRKQTSRYLYLALNGPSFWPFSYADLRRILAAHNGTISTWAAENGVAVIDIDGRMPARPELCADAYHDVPIAQRMRAWLIFQAMLPRLYHDIREHLVPRDNSIAGDKHPWLDKPVEVIDRDEWLARAKARTVSSAPTE